jgi:hypothetical protein
MSLEIERKPIDLNILPQTLHKHLDPAAPEPLKMMAARGMLPVSPEENVTMLYALALVQGEVGNEAIRTFEGMPSEIVVPALQKANHDGVLDWAAARRRTDPFILEAIVTNHASHSNTIARIARMAGANLCDVIATNQVRILEAPQILEQMYQNPHARMATVDRLLELCQREGVKLKGLPGVQAIMDSGRDVFGDDENAAEVEELLKQQSAIADAEAKSLEQLDGMSRAEREEYLRKAEEEAEKGTTNLQAQIANMSISQKVRLATVGSRAALNTLVRDPNKLVHMAAVRSPRIQYPDVRAWARNKTLPDGVIGYIATNKDYTRHYEVIHALCQNPKTPLRDTMKFLNHLRSNDLKQLASDRRIPMQVSRQAKQLYRKRSGGGG